ncbi:TonB-dependent copper receptor [Pseudomonas sp. RIT-PI-AD]|uniref:TonB-dependent copper receptor n=1 Tax=Pseudomonas sp. RIT-PI-AD TaxID=3035294 RepID=UPI0021D9BF3D|nr:TonB-dependent copper receptor [Pseudomonas sp. RIT-PI-AD]
MFSFPAHGRPPVARPFRLSPLARATCLRGLQALAAGGALGVVPMLQAAEAPAAAGPERDLPATVVTAVAPRSPLTLVTDPKAPRQPVPASDGADYLKTFPGFAVIRNGGSNGDPVLRGMFGSRLNILANGGQMLGACPGRMDAPTSYIAPETYDRLTVIKGPQSVLWGPMGSAGTVLFEREPERFGALGSRVDGSLLAGSDGRLDKRLDAAVGDPDGYLRFVGNHARADDYQDGHGDRVPSRWRKWNGDVALGWTPDPDTLVELSAGRGDGEARYAGRGMDGAQFQRESLGLRVERDNLGETLEKLEARLYYNYADHVMDNYSLRRPSGHGMMAGPMASNVDRRTLGGRLAATWRWDDLQLVAGVDGQANTHRKRMGMGEGTYDQVPWNKDAAFHTYGAFGELTWYAAERDRLIGGARLDRTAAKDYRPLSGSGMMARANPSADETRRDTLPGGFLRYEHDLLDYPATWYAGLGHTQRFPDYWELFSPEGSPGAANAFEGVAPEKTTQLDVGLQYQGEHLESWASLYAATVQDFILFDYTAGGAMGPSSVARNVDARTFGGEAGLAYHWDARWKSEASLAYAWGQNRSDGRALPQIPPLEARLGLTYVRDDWSAGALWRLVAAQHRVAEGQGNVVGQDFAGSAGFGVFALNGSYRLTRNLRLSAGVDNLLDKAYAEHLNLAGDAGFGYPAEVAQAIAEPGRTLWTKVDFSF